MSSAKGLATRVRDWIASDWSRIAAATLEGRITRTTLAISTGTIITVLSASYLMVRYYALANLNTVAQAEAQLRATRIETGLNRQVQELLEMSASSLFTNALADTEGRKAYLGPYLAQLMTTSGRYHWLALVDLNGRVLASSGGSIQGRVEWLEPPVAAMLEAGIPSVRVDENDRPMVMLPVLYPPTGTVEGVLLASIAMDHAFDGDPLDTFSESALTLETASGTVVARHRPLSARAPAPRTIRRPLRLFQPLDRLDVSLVTLVDDSRALSLSHSLGAGFALSGLLAFLASLVLSRRMARQVSAPVMSLSAAARAFASRGSGNVEDIPRVGDGEVAILADSLRDMAEAVSRRQATLEEMVAARTADLTRARDSLEDILSTVNEAVWSYDAVDQRLTYASASMAKLVEMPLDELLDRAAPWPALLDLDGQPRIVRMVKALATGSLPNTTIDHVVHAANGTRRHVSTKVFARRTSDGTLLRVDGISADISDRIAADERMRLMQRVIEFSANGVTVADNLAEDLPLIYVNPAFERITGYSAIEVLGRNCRMLHAGDNLQPGVRQVRAAVRSGTPCEVVVRNYRKSGEMFWNSLTITPVRNADNVVTHLVGILSDITAQVQANAQRERYAAELDTIFSLSPDGFASVDSSGNVSSANQALLEMTGIDRASVVGASFGLFKEALRARAAPDKPFPAFALAPDSPAGDALAPEILHLVDPARTLQVTLRSTLLTDTPEVLYFRDVTREFEIDRLKSEFLTTAAHELRTPMSSVLGFSHLLMNRELAPDVRSEIYRTIHEQAGRVSSLLNELLDLARIEARAAKEFNFTVTSLQETVERVLAGMLVPGDDRKIAFLPPDQWPPVRVDPGKFAQALTNVLSNAYKYSPEGGEIRLCVESNDRQVIVQVRDQGIGMSEAVQQRVFERFYRADASGSIPGTGLGLSLVKEILEAHGGTCTISSQPGQGSTVSLALPRADAPGETAKPPATPG